MQTSKMAMPNNGARVDNSDIPDDLSSIAKIIKSDWKKMYFGAVPYVDAMFSLTSIDDVYGAEDARTIVTYFLGNAVTWKGETARRIKSKLKDLRDSKPGKR
jgi:hypothetical protein